jgi:hypothetical protein
MNFVGLRIVDPIVVTDAVLISSNVPEDDGLGLYNPVTGYTLGQRCFVDHVLYENVLASGANTGNAPAANPTKWKKVSATNRFKLFDAVNSTATVFPANISLRLRPGAAVNTVGFLNLANVTSVRARMVDPVAGVVYERTQYLTGTLVQASWHAFFFSKRYPATDALFTDLPSYPNADIWIEINSSFGGQVGIGTFVMGQTVEIGDGVRFGVKVGIVDYSRQTQNDYGDLVLGVGTFAKRASFPLRVPMIQVDAVQAQFAAIRSKPVLFIGYEPLQCTVVFGIYKNFEILISYATFADCSVDLLGLN